MYTPVDQTPPKLFIGIVVNRMTLIISGLAIGVMPNIGPIHTFNFLPPQPQPIFARLTPNLLQRNVFNLGIEPTTN